MTTYHIHISGQVQGVGFRPWVYRLANQLELKGWVNNSTDGVHIEVNADKKLVTEFVHQVINGAPLQAKIEKHTLEKVDARTFNDFTIIESLTQGNKEIRLSPDFAMCTSCEAELLDDTNRRNLYPFITCTECGPRYSIQTHTPFDRSATSMQSFVMCKTCLDEYNNPSDSRFYAQTNSCKQCGVKISIHDSSGKIIETKSQLQTIIDAIMHGKTVAVKGIGGFILMCDATNEAAIQLLRQRKARPSKPLALLYSDIASLQQDVNIEEDEINLLTSEAAPIVLVELKQNPLNKIKTSIIAPNLNKLGVMIPNAPLFKLIAKEFGKPLIATSGNLSGAPITYKNNEAIQQLAAFADLIITNDREIVMPQDDSVAQMINGRLNLVRRSRGYAPSYFGSTPEDQIDGVIAMGADLKASIAISQSNQWYVSQFLGNQEQFESQEAYHKVLHRLIHLSGVKPSCILVDKHPMYFTCEFGNTWSGELNIPLVTIQHHEAHFAAVLQENDLMNSTSRVLGVVWDGTGYGTDGNSWGGEFFEYNLDTIHRVNHLGYVPILVGDKMAKQPRISAFAFCHTQLAFAGDLLKQKFLKKEYELYAKMVGQSQQFTSSIGRLFDAVASLLGLCNKSSYEGEAAMYLQHLATTVTTSIGDSYLIKIEGESISTHLMIQEILKEIKEGVPKNKIAWRFHLTLVEMIRTIAQKSGYKQIAFSGGVFQNSLLIELIEKRLTNFNLYFHKELPSNDENISFGQLAHYHMTQRKLRQTTKSYEVSDRI